MRKLIVLAVVGLLAQLVDGSLGMGYGVTSSTLLVLAGLTPAAASASVHFSELGTNLASGLSVGSFVVDTGSSALYLNVVPEPGTAAMLFMAAAALGIFPRKRKRA